MWVNPAFTQITGYSLPDIVGKTPSILKSGVLPSSFYKELWDTILSGRVWHGELSNRHKLGHIYIEEQTIAPVTNRAGAITHFIGVKQDITQRKLREEMLERRNAELAVMASTIATITSSPEVDSVLESIVGSIKELLPGAMGATIQVEARAGRLATRAATQGLPRSPSGLVFEPGQGIAGLCFETSQIVNVPDVGEDDRFLPGSSKPAYRSLLAVPIDSGGRALGVLCVESAQANAFSSHEERLSRLFAGSAAIAMLHAAEYQGRARAERELKRYSEHLESMVEERTADLKLAQERLLEQQRLEREVALAAEVQSSILPHRKPDLPGYEFEGVALAARYVSGDMYDWSGSSAERCYLALADIAGKGVPAAMMTSTARALLRETALRKVGPSETLTGLNRFLYDDLTRAGMFITLVVASLEQRTAALDYASAGHTEVLWFRSWSGTCERLSATAPPIGVLREYAVGERRVLLCPGDVLVFYSDGVTEAADAADQLFGTERLIEVLTRSSRLSAADLANSIVGAVDRFSKGLLSDDLTLIVVKALPRTVSFHYPGDLEHMQEAVALVRTIGEAYGRCFAYELELAASEILTNIAQHSYQGTSGEVRGELRLEGDRLELDLYDDGAPFDIAAVPARRSPEATEGGYGLHIVRELMDEVAYSAGTQRGNHWHLVKRRGQGGKDDGG